MVPKEQAQQPAPCSVLKAQERKRMQVGWTATYKGHKDSAHPEPDTLLLSTQREICPLHLPPPLLALNPLTPRPPHWFAPLHPLLFGPWEPSFCHHCLPAHTQSTLGPDTSSCPQQFTLSPFKHENT